MKATWSREFRTELYNRIDAVIKERHRRIDELQLQLVTEIDAHKARNIISRWVFSAPNESYFTGSDTYRRLINNQDRLVYLEALKVRVNEMFSGGATAITLQDEEVRWVQ